MNNVWYIALRPACSSIGVSRSTAGESSLRRAFSTIVGSRRTLLGSARQQLHESNPIGPLLLRSNLRAGCRSFSSSMPSQFSKANAFKKLVPYKPKQLDQGLAFRDTDLTSIELTQVLSQNVRPTSFANRLLRVLHARRVDGTLDLDLPAEITGRLQAYPNAVDEGLQWLREHYPIDEEDAILERIEREESEVEKESPAQLMQRAEELGIYKPQSGRYAAKLGEEGDVFGESELEKIRAENVAKAEQEAKELDAKINKLQDEVKEKFGELQVQPENAIEVSTSQRRLNSYEKWRLKHKMAAESKLTLDSPEVISRSKPSRLLPSLIFTTAVCAICYFFAEYWVPPKRVDREWPNLSLSAATVTALIVTNLLVWFLWKIPSSWRLLLRYGVTSPATPRPFSMLGNTFSHQSFYHLSLNMAFLVLFGMSLHEDVGRGIMLATYIAAGTVGSWVSLANFTFRNILTTTSLGASGSLAGIVGMYLTIHGNDNFILIVDRFLPKDWQDKFVFKGFWFLAFIVGAEIVWYFSPLRTVDYASHLGGYAVGIISGLWWSSNHGKRKRKRHAIEHGHDDDSSYGEELNWFERILGKRP